MEEKLYKDYDLIEYIRYDKVGEYSFTSLQDGALICKKLLNLKGITPDSIVTDAMAGIGGNCVEFARHFKHVNAIELNRTRESMLSYNMGVFDLPNVDTFCDYYQNLMYKLEQDIIFFDPPWGGESYIKKDKIRLQVDDKCGKIALEDLIVKSASLCKYVVVKLPINYDIAHFDEIARTVGHISTQQYRKPGKMIIKIIKTY